MKHFKKLSDLHQASGAPPPENPLLSLIQCGANACCVNEIEFSCDCYLIGFKKMKAGTMLYGKTKYDHDRGSMSFIKPRQIVAFKNIQLEENGFLLYIHEDYLTGTALHAEIKKYGYFDYETNEALHLSPAEEEIIWDLYHKLEKEYHNNTDEYSKAIMLTHIDSILKYAQRFYKRQFINRTSLSGTTVTKFNGMLTAYFEQGMLSEKGLPTVHFMAEKLNISPRYLSDLLKQETGKTALELIHIFLVTEAKNLLTEGTKSISEISYALGFENPSYFSRLFKKEAGMTPNAFRDQFAN